MKREQLLNERIDAILDRLESTGVFDEETGERLKHTRERREAKGLSDSAGKPASVTRNQITGGTKNEMQTAYDSQDTQEMLRIVWEVISGEDLEGS